MIRIFTGIDHRETMGWHVFCQSVMKHALSPVSIVPITEVMGLTYAGASDGTNAFSKSRFLVPYLCGFEGWAIWADGADMMLRANVNDLWALRDPNKAVQIVPHHYLPKHQRKYIGTPMEARNDAYPRKNWSSLVLWNCAEHRNLTPAYLQQASPRDLHRFSWLDDEEIGHLPLAWNWLDEYGYNPHVQLVHYTNGIPGFSHYRDAVFADEWYRLASSVTAGLQTLPALTGA